MDFSTDQDHESVRSSVRGFLTRSGTEADVRRIMESEPGHDPDGWAALGKRLGVTAIGVPEELGGAGFGFAELAIVLEELGTALYPSPLFGSRVLAAEALMRSGDERVADEVAALADGETIGCLALSEHSGAWRPDRVSVKATPAGDGYSLEGRASFVVDGAAADLVVVVADLAGEPSLFLVPPDAEGLEREPLQTVDLTRRQARLTFDGCPARLVGTPGTAPRVVASVLDLAAIALAAEQVGGAQRCLDLAVDHAKTRVQFGRPIGSFQAVKHKCADVLLELDAARTAVRTAAWSVDNAPDEVPVLASLVKAHCSEMYELAARECIQIHGGMGFTWEYAAQLYFKRAHSSALMFGTPDHHREALADRLKLGA
ncbi:acyl-CoA dehydrogenase family protein [Actinomadura vinacea]|uniref:Acyl-CoA dehydrogenase family protein n=1 Tax=Actinomadura vinacea TaxID=115336 RepID=A0ABP5X803_9ACTN